MSDRRQGQAGSRCDRQLSIGILGGALAVFGFKVIEPIVSHLTTWLGNGVEKLVNHSLLPWRPSSSSRQGALLNNAINHGVPDAPRCRRCDDEGQVHPVQLESQPGPGAGLLLA